MLSINSAYAEQVTCLIEAPSLTAVDTDSFIWTECIGVGCNEVNSTDSACTSSCPDTNSTCCQEEGQYTWNVSFSSSNIVDTWTCPGTVNGPQCSGNAYSVFWDGSQTWCDCHTGSGNWSLGGEVASSTCCGDDPGESSNTRLCNSGCNSSGSDDACCSLATDCVYSDQCYDTGTCRGTSLYCTNGTWSDPDDNQAYCDNCAGSGNWLKGECCGDDAGEMESLCQDNGEDYCSRSTDNIACCNDLDCVFNGNCYSNGYTTGSWICNRGDWHDFVDPSISDNYAPTNWATGSHSITLTPQDESGGSGIASVRYCRGPTCTPSSGTLLPSPYNIPLSVTTNDIYRYQAWDLAGNPSTIESVSVKIDNTDPVTFCSNCPSSTEIMGKSFTITLLYDDVDSGVASTQYCVYKEPETTCSNFAAYPSQGVIIGADCTNPGEVCEYGIRFYSIDSVGNQETTRESSDMTIDNSLPWCDVNSFPDQYMSNRNVGITWDAGDRVSASTFSGYIITAEQSFNDGDSWSQVDSITISSESTKSHTFNLETDGFFRFSCVARYTRDVIVESTPDRETATVDTTPPTVQFTMDTIVREETFTVTWLGDDQESGIERYALSVNSGSLDDNIPETQNSYVYTGTFGQTYTFGITAYDYAGNPSQDDTVTVAPDNQSPSCNMASLLEFQTENDFTVSWYSPDSDVDVYDLCISTSGPECSQPTPGWIGLQETSDQVTGSHGYTYNIRCRATDMTGNVGEWSAPVTTSIDTRPPGLQESYTANVVAGETFEDLVVNVTISDDAGIQSVSFEVGGSSVSPSFQSGSAGDLEWIVYWEIPYSTYASSQEFTISTSDVNGNSDDQVFSYSVLLCSPGSSRECHPVDKAKDEVYNLGVCAASGSKICTSEGEWGNCTGGTFPRIEDCNGLDDDCDGSIDDGLANDECGHNNIGICQMGSRSCFNGSWGTCIGYVQPQTENCMTTSLDDDCDGAINEDCECDEGETQPCGESNVGICSFGQQICSNGWFGECVGAVYSEPEVCDALDNDCDGEKDEGCGEPGPDPDSPEPFPWWMLSVIGVVILAVLLILYFSMKKEGKELTWESLKKKYTPGKW